MKVSEIFNKINEKENIKDDCVQALKTLRSCGDWECDIGNDKREVVWLLYSEYLKVNEMINKLLDKETK